jgi:uncharacterized membrane protein
MESKLPDDPATDEIAAVASLRRVHWIAVSAWAAFAIFLSISRGFRAFVGLTCSAAVAIISFLWLEEIVRGVLQPSAKLHPRRLVLRTLSRFVLLGVAAWVTVLVARFDAVGVLLGFSVVVVGILGEALYSVYRGFAG